MAAADHALALLDRIVELAVGVTSCGRRRYLEPFSTRDAAVRPGQGRGLQQVVVRSWVRPGSTPLAHQRSEQATAGTPGSSVTPSSSRAAGPPPDPRRGDATRPRPGRPWPPAATAGPDRCGSRRRPPRSTRPPSRPRRPTVDRSIMSNWSPALARPEDREPGCERRRSPLRNTLPISNAVHPAHQALQVQLGAMRRYRSMPRAWWCVTNGRAPPRRPTANTGVSTSVKPRRAARAARGRRWTGRERPTAVGVGDQVELTLRARRPGSRDPGACRAAEQVRARP